MPVPQFAYQRGAEALPRAWSRYTPGTTANAQQAARQHPAEAAAEQPRKDRKQPKAKQREPGMAAHYMPPLIHSAQVPFAIQLLAAQLHAGAYVCNVNIRPLASSQARTMNSCRSFSRSCSPGGRQPSGPTTWRQQPAAGQERSHSRFVRPCGRCWGRVLSAARQYSVRPGGDCCTRLDVCTATARLQDILRRRLQILLMGGCRRSPGSQRLCRQPAMTRMTSCMRICQLPGSRRQVTWPAAP